MVTLNLENKKKNIFYFKTYISICMCIYLKIQICTDNKLIYTDINTRMMYIFREYRRVCVNSFLGSCVFDLVSDDVG